MTSHKHRIYRLNRPINNIWYSKVKTSIKSIASAAARRVLGCHQSLFGQCLSDVADARCLVSDAHRRRLLARLTLARCRQSDERQLQSQNLRIAWTGLW